jgi:hypothetical protein
MNVIIYFTSIYGEITSEVIEEGCATADIGACGRQTGSHINLEAEAVRGLPGKFQADFCGTAQFI